jgi:hypothetical protein
MTGYREAGVSYREHIPYRGLPVVPPPTSPVSYRLVLASLGTSGIGAPIVSHGIPLDDVLNQIGVAPGASVPLGWKKNLNGPGSIEFSLPIDDPFVTPANFAPGKREIHVYRDDGSGEVLWAAGRLWTADVADWGMRFTASGWIEDLRHREVLTDLVYSGLEQHDMAWNYIDYTQNLLNGNRGITRHDTTPTGVTRDIEICAEQRRGIAELVDEIASTDDGFDWEISPGKVFRIFFPHRGTTPGVTFDLRTEIEVLSYTLDGTTLSNEVSGIGQVNQCDPVANDVVSDLTAQAEYGLLQSSIQRQDDDEQLLLGQIREELRNHKTPRMQPLIGHHPAVAGPSVDAYEVGDNVRAIASRGFATFNQLFRVLSVGAVVDHDLEYVTVQLDGVTS